MSFENLLTHTVRVYREPDPLTSRDAMGNVPTVPELVDALTTGFNARPDQFYRDNLKDSGPGEIGFRLWRWFIHKDEDVQERDVLLVTAGEHAGKKLKVMGLLRVSGRRSLHHLEANCEPWEGELG